MRGLLRLKLKIGTLLCLLVFHCPNQGQWPKTALMELSLLLWGEGSSHTGSMHREPDVGFDPGSPGSRPGPKAGAKPLRHPGIPTLSFKEAKILKKYKDSKGVLLTTCKTCNRTVKHHGKSRSFLSALKSSPTSKLSLKTPERKTPSSAKLSQMYGSKGKSPDSTFRTPTSGQSTPTCASKNMSKRNTFLN
ncbi:unnamed protein product [Nyctereutes procyonoides]|uniref:(raccoon dog) hypothetical protein n=1 Tax=Nyctereutes procyonoides TaxID=34880 RepID=A0A811YTP6_NYCPR|nr:unnamed protein product [Nyctereutes procyonoides]